MTTPSWTRAPVRLVARARLRRGWVGIVVVGLIGAIGAAGALATLAGARRTDTAHERLRAETDAFDGRASFLGGTGPETAARVAAFRLLPELGPSTPTRFRVGRRADTQDWISATSIPGLDGAAGRRQIVRGRPFRIDHPNEAVLSQHTAEAMDLDLGDEIGIDFYTNQQFTDVLDNYFIRPEGATARLEVVGIARDPDDAGGGRILLVGPAFLLTSETTPGFFGVFFTLAPGVTRAEAERAIARLPGEQPDIEWSSDTTSALDNTRQAIVGGLLIAAAVIALAAIIAVVQAAARQVDLTSADREALAALGLAPRDRIAAATLPGLVAAGVAGVGGIAGAVALSGRFPIGRMREFEPQPGTTVDLLLLGAGFAAVVLLVVVAFAFAAWRSERRGTRAPARGGPNPLGPRAERWAFGPSTLMGTRFAIERGPSRRSVPVRTSLLGIAAGITGVVAALTFAASLHAFVTTPARYGQPWSLSVETLGDAGAPQRLAADRDVDAAAVVRSIDATVAGQRTTVHAVEVLEGSFSPTLESGRMPAGPDEIVLGPTLLRATGRALGDDVAVRGGAAETMRIVGTALNLDPQDERFGSVAFVAPAALDRLRGDAPLYNEETTLRFADGSDADAVSARLKAAIPYGLTDESLPARPAAVANVAEIGDLPTVIAVVLGALGVIAVTHVVVVAVRRRRHELAVLGALGMTRRQRARVVVVMALAMITAGLVIGLPVGLLLGTFVWSLVAGGLQVEPAAVVPAGALLAVGAGAVAVTLLVAVLPARAAARVRPAAVLRTE